MSRISSNPLSSQDKMTDVYVGGLSAEVRCRDYVGCMRNLTISGNCLTKIKITEAESHTMLLMAVQLDHTWKNVTHVKMISV